MNEVTAPSKGSYFGHPACGFGQQSLDDINYIVCDVIKHAGDKTVYLSGGTGKNELDVLGFLIPEAPELRKAPRSIKVVSCDKSGVVSIWSPAQYKDLIIVRLFFFVRVFLTRSQME
jgi:hypothetical protein